jgi:Protein of unknown function (DUF3788)
MSVGKFTDKKHQPTEAEVLAAVGTRLPLWQELLSFVRTNYPVQEDFKFMYGKNYGWAYRFRIKGQFFTSFYPAEDGFAVHVNLSPSAVEQALSLPPGKNVQQAIERAIPYPEGRWLFIRVESQEDAADIRHLWTLRLAMKRVKSS